MICYEKRGVINKFVDYLYEIKTLIKIHQLHFEYTISTIIFLGYIKNLDIYLRFFNKLSNEPPLKTN